MNSTKTHLKPKTTKTTTTSTTQPKTTPTKKPATLMNKPTSTTSTKTEKPTSKALPKKGKGPRVETSPSQNSSPPVNLTRGLLDFNLY